VAWLGLAAALAAALGGGVGDPRVWSGLAVGRAIATSGIPRYDVFTIVGEGAPWLDLRWLYHWLLYWAFRAGGEAGVWLLGVAAGGGGMAIAARLAARRGGPMAAAAAGALVVLLVAPLLQLSAALVAMVPAAVVGAAALGEGGRKGRIAAVIAQVVWANLEPGALLGPLAAVAALAVRSEFSAGRPRPRRGDVVFGAALAAALLATPYGPAGLAFAARQPEFFKGGMTDAGSPTLMHLRSAPPALWPVVLVLLVIGIGLAMSQRPLAPDSAALGVIGLLAVLFAPALSPAAVVLALPIAAESVRELGRAAGQMFLPRRMPPGRVALAGGIAAALVGGLVAVMVPVRGSPWAMIRPPPGRLEDRHLPSALADALNRHGLSPRVACLPSDGAMLAWKMPGRPVFEDLRLGRSATRSPPILLSYLPDPGRAAAELKGRWNIDAVLLNPLSPAVFAHLDRWRTSRSWRLAYFDGASALFVRDGASDVLGVSGTEAALREEGLARLKADGDEMAASRRHALSPRVIGAALYFTGAGHPREAATAFDLLRRSGVRLPLLDLYLGRNLLAAGEYGPAQEALQRHVRRHLRSAEGWRALAELLLATGRTNEADRAAREALRLRGGKDGG